MYRNSDNVNYKILIEKLLKPIQVCEKVIENKLKYLNQMQDSNNEWVESFLMNYMTFVVQKLKKKKYRNIFREVEQYEIDTEKVQYYRYFSQMDDVKSPEYIDILSNEEMNHVLNNIEEVQLLMTTE